MIAKNVSVIITYLRIPARCERVISTTNIQNLGLQFKHAQGITQTLLIGRCNAGRAKAPPLAPHYRGGERPLRLLDARSSNCCSLMDCSIERDGPFRSLTFCSPRLTDNAAPAALC